jgi:hypothetical protein
VARFIADQRTEYGVPHAVTCDLLGVSRSWFYKWLARTAVAGPYTDTERRRMAIDAAVKAAFVAADGRHGSPRLVNDLRSRGWRISEKTVANSMRRQGLKALRGAVAITAEAASAPASVVTAGARVTPGADGPEPHSLPSQ